jgi:6-phospho-beta-glucosidase
VKIAILGGGGFRTPLTMRALGRAARRLDIHEVTLHDVDASRLNTICRVVEAMQARASDAALHVTPTTDLESAVRDAAFVWCAVRVGGLRARALDERVALGLGLVGQETVGAAGLCLIMRSVGALTDIATTLARVAPNAWIINLTNPVGSMCAVLRETVGDRVIGVCDTPTDLVRRVAALLGPSTEPFRFDYYGLNHLGWLRSVYAREQDVLPGLLADDVRINELEEARLFGAKCLRALGAVPNEYLSYYYFPEKHLEAVRAAGHSRAESLLQPMESFYRRAADSQQDALQLWQGTRADRDRSYLSDTGVAVTGRTADGSAEGYAAVAVAVMDSIATHVATRQIVDVANRGTLRFLPPSATVEVPCTIDGRGASAAHVGDVPEHASALMQRVYAAEHRAVDAARTRSSVEAIAALAAHPLIDSTSRAEQLFRAYVREQPAFATQFE